MGKAWQKMATALDAMVSSSPEFLLQGLKLSSHLKLPPPQGKRHQFQITATSKKDVGTVWGHASAMVHTWPHATMIHPRKHGQPFRVLTVNMTQKQEARQGFYNIEKKHEEVHDAIVRLVDEVAQSALGPGAIRSFNGDLVSHEIDSFRYAQSVSIIGVAPKTPSQNYHRDGPTMVMFRGEEAFPVYYNIMVPLSTNCTDTEYLTEATEGASYFEAGVEYYAFDGSRWHRGAANGTSEWQFKLFISLVQEDLREAVTLPIIMGKEKGYTDHVHHFF